MEPERSDEQVAALLNSLNKGQYLILMEAVRQLGGQLRLNWDQLTANAGALPQMYVDASDGPVVLQLADTGDSMEHRG
jgi:hypothetical protein